MYGINHLTGGIFTISGENGKAVYTDVATVQDTKIFIQEEEDYSYALLPDTVAASGNTVLMLMNTWDDKGRVTNLYALSLTDGSVRKANVENVRNFCAYKDGKFLVIALQKREDGTKTATASRRWQWSMTRRRYDDDAVQQHWRER